MGLGGRPAVGQPWRRAGTGRWGAASASSPGLCKQGEFALFCSSGLGEGWLEPEAPGPTVAPPDPCGPQPPLQPPAAPPHPPPCVASSSGSCCSQMPLLPVGLGAGGWGWGRVTERSDGGSGVRAGPSPGPGLELCAPREGSQCPSRVRVPAGHSNSPWGHLPGRDVR